MSPTAFAQPAVDSFELTGPDVTALAALATIGTERERRAESAVPTGFPTTTCVTWACQ